MQPFQPFIGASDALLYRSDHARGASVIAGVLALCRGAYHDGPEMRTRAAVIAAVAGLLVLVGAGAV